jgi:hypothetical protein
MSQLGATPFTGSSDRCKLPANARANSTRIWHSPAHDANARRRLREREGCPPSLIAGRARRKLCHHLTPGSELQTCGSAHVRSACYIVLGSARLLQVRLAMTRFVAAATRGSSAALGLLASLSLVRCNDAHARLDTIDASYAGSASEGGSASYAGSASEGGSESLGSDAGDDATDAGPSTTYTEANCGSTVSTKVGERFAVSLASTYWQFQSLPAATPVKRSSDVTTTTQGCPIFPPGSGCGIETANFESVTAGSVVISASRGTCGEAEACGHGEGIDQCTIVVDVEP